MQFLRKRSIAPVSIAFVIFSGLILWIHPQGGAALMAGGWAYMATRNYGSTIPRFFRYLLLLGILEALLGLVQYFLLPGWILGYQNPFYTTSGTLINHNHFAGLLEMLIPVAFGFAYASARETGDLARAY